MGRRVISVSILTLIATAAAMAQTSNRESTIVELQRQLDEMRSQMAKMQNRMAELQGELETVKGSAETNSNTHPILVQSQTSSAQAFRSQPDETKSPKEPTSFQYKGLTLTPGGFLEGPCWSVLAMKTRILQIVIQRFRWMDRRTQS
jgi:uncharacterized coiled-coil protein SlyX